MLHKLKATELAIEKAAERTYFLRFALKLLLLDNTIDSRNTRRQRTTSDEMVSALPMIGWAIEMGHDQGTDQGIEQGMLSNTPHSGVALVIVPWHCQAFNDPTMIPS